MYTVHNFATKKSLQESFQQGHIIRVYQPGLGSTEGNHVIEGPHGIHKWYQKVVVKNGVITELRK